MMVTDVCFTNLIASHLNIAEIVHFLDPENANIQWFLDPEILKKVQNISGSRNRKNTAISGSGNRKNGPTNFWIQKSKK